MRLTSRLSLSRRASNNILSSPSIWPGSSKQKSRLAASNPAKPALCSSCSKIGSCSAGSFWLAVRNTIHAHCLRKSPSFQRSFSAGRWLIAARGREISGVKKPRYSSQLKPHNFHSMYEDVLGACGAVPAPGVFSARVSNTPSATSRNVPERSSSKAKSNENVLPTF